MGQPGVAILFSCSPEELINVGLLEVVVECQDDEGRVEHDGKNGSKNEEHHKVNRLVQHCPEAKGQVPSKSYSYAKHPKKIHHLPHHHPHLLVGEVTDRFAISSFAEEGIDEEEVGCDVEDSNGEDQVKEGTIKSAANNSSQS